MNFIGDMLLLLLQIYFYIVIISVIISWLVTFEVINAKNEKARNLLNLLGKLTEPVYKPIRKYVPNIGGIDISPIIVIFAIYILQRIVIRLFY
jgi:YggT family protein